MGRAVIPRCHTRAMDEAGHQVAAGEADLRGWLDLAPTLDWTFAKTYAQTAPHSWDADLINPATTGRVYGPQEDFDTERLRSLRLMPDEHA